MPVTWKWKEKIGSLTWSEFGNTYKVNIYKGNCLCVLIYEYRDEHKIKRYNFNGFFNDAAHLKRCVGLMKDHTGKYNNIYKDIWKKWKLNTFYKESMQLASILTKAGFKVELYYKEIKQ